jgi:hypothetical protein
MSNYVIIRKFSITRGKPEQKSKNYYPQLGYFLVANGIKNIEDRQQIFFIPCICSLILNVNRPYARAVFI